MQRSPIDYMWVALKGVAMGAADVVPGVSGGTIAFISGIYEELIRTISAIDLSLLRIWKQEGFSKAWTQLNGNFLVALIIGIAFSVFTVMRLANYLLENHPVLIWSFFFGLVVASIVFVGKQIKNWGFIQITALLLATGLAYYLTTLPPMSATPEPWFIFVAGALAICAMILPGISGAFILVLLGAYKAVSEAVHNFDIKTILIFMIGALTGLLSFSKVLRWLFKNYESLTLAVLTGFIIGSLNKIWPWKETLESQTFGDKTIVIKEASVTPFAYKGDPQFVLSLVLMVVGFTVIFGLEHIASQKDE